MNFDQTQITSKEPLAGGGNPTGESFTDIRQALSSGIGCAALAAAVMYSGGRRSKRVPTGTA